MLICDKTDCNGAVGHVSLETRECHAGQAFLTGPPWRPPVVRPGATVASLRSPPSAPGRTTGKNAGSYPQILRKRLFVEHEVDFSLVRHRAHYVDSFTNPSLFAHRSLAIRSIVTANLILTANPSFVPPMNLRALFLSSL